MYGRKGAQKPMCARMHVNVCKRVSECMCECVHVCMQLPGVHPGMAGAGTSRPMDPAALALASGGAGMHQLHGAGTMVSTWQAAFIAHLLLEAAAHGACGIPSGGF